MERCCDLKGTGRQPLHVIAIFEGHVFFNWIFLADKLSTIFSKITGKCMNKQLAYLACRGHATQPATAAGDICRGMSLLSTIILLTGLCCAMKRGQWQILPISMKILKRLRRDRTGETSIRSVLIIQGTCPCSVHYSHQHPFQWSVLSPRYYHFLRDNGIVFVSYNTATHHSLCLA